MKKLLIAMTAAAVGFGAWAEDAVTYLNSYVEEFGTSWTLKAPWSYLTKDGETATLEDGELTAGDALTLNTGSKILRGAFAANPIAIPDDSSLYFSSTVTFKDPSDTLPELGASDKFALVVLDNIESVEEGQNTTNLWVIAQYGETSGTKRAYKLTIPTQLDEEGNITDSITDLTADWLSSAKRIEIRAYKNVMATTQAERAGFLVAVEGFVCQVYASYPIVDGVIDFTEAGIKYGMSSTDEYLGVAVDAIAGAVQERYNNDQLILSLVDNAGNLLSVDFQGQGAIDKVALKETPTADFGPDALVLNVAKTEGIAFVQGTSALMYYSKNGSVTIKFTVAEGFELSSPAATDNLSFADDVYTYVYTPIANNQTVTISAFKPVVSVVVGAETKKYGSLSEAISKVAAGAELTLTGDIALTEAITIAKDITINLNGKKLSAVLNDTVKAMFTLNGATLTIVDSGNGILEVTGGDRSIARTANAAGLTIKNGTIDAKVAAAKVACTIEGGKFLKAANEEITVDAEKYEVDGETEANYYIVKDKPAAPSTFAVIYEAGNFTLTKLNGETYEAFTSGTELANGIYTFKVAAVEGYDIDSVTVGGADVEVAENGTFSVSGNGANVAIVVTASLKTFTATYSVVDAEGNTVENGANVSGLEDSYQWGAKLTFTVAPVGDYIVKSVKINGEEANGSYEVSEVKANVVIVVTVEKNASAGPTIAPGQGEVSKPDVNGNVTVTPAAGVTEITISGTVTGTVSIPSSVTKVTGVAFEKLEITYTPSQGGETKVITGAFKADAQGNIVLNEEGSVNGVPVKPAMTEDAPFVVGGDTTDVQVKTIPGLVYKLMRGTDLNSINDERASETGTGAPVTLSDPKEAQRPTKAFYKIQVTR